MVTLKIGGKPVSFLVDTGATYSVLKKPEEPSSKPAIPIQGATGKTKLCTWTKARITDLGKSTITHSFLMMPDCPYPLLGRDLLHKLGATITFSSDSAELHMGDKPITLLVSCPLGEEYQLLPEDIPGELITKTLLKDTDEYGNNLPKKTS